MQAPGVFLGYKIEIEIDKGNECREYAEEIMSRMMMNNVGRPLTAALRLSKKLFSTKYCCELIAQSLVDARFAYSDFIIDKIHRLLCGISSSQKISN